MSTPEELQAEIARLKAENEALKTRGSKGLSMKVSEKGALSIYGMGRFPVTLYQEQWTKLLDMADDIRAFIKENEPRLKKKE
jgi:predicted component of type VI protein secretion system